MNEFNLEKNKRDYNRIKDMALKDGFSEEELETTYLNKLSKKTKSARINRMILLAYYLGWLRGIKYCDEGYSPIKLDDIK